MPWDFISSKGSSGIASLIDSESRTVAGNRIDIAAKTISNSILMFGSIAYCLHISAKLTAIFAITFPPVYFFSKYFQKKISKSSLLESNKLAAARLTLQRTIESVILLRFFSLDKLAQSNVRKSFSDFSEQSIQGVRASSKLTSVSRIIIFEGQVLIMILAAYSVISGEITVGGYTVITNTFWKLASATAGFSALAGLNARVNAAKNNLEEIDSKIRDSELQKYSEYFNFTNLSFEYGGAKILDGASFTLRSGDRIVLEGQNGSGKSTLLNLICGMLHAEEVKPLDPQYVSAMVNVPTFLTSTLGEHFEIDKMSKEDQGIVSEMLEEFGLFKLMSSMPDQLSQGQKRKAMLAIALSKRAQFYLIDEPFAAVDHESKSILARWIGRMTGGKALVIVAHGDSELVKPLVTQVATLRDGKISISS